MGTAWSPYFYMRAEFAYNNRNERTEARRYDTSTAGTKVSSTDYGFDDGGRFTSQVLKDGAGAALVTYANAYDAANRIITETRNGTPKNFTYDVNSQVTSDGTGTYSNDLNGNRTMAGYVNGAANRTTTDGIWTYTHNAEGNIIKRSKGASQETWTYGYDHNNRLVWVEKRDTDGGVLRTRVDYKYDALNNRIFDKVDEYSAGGILLSSVTSKHVFDGQNVYADLDSAGAITTRYLLGDALGQRYGRVDSSTGYFLLTDRLGSVREVLTLAGAISSVIAYDAFGNILSESNPATSGNYLFTGLLYWRATGMYGTPNRELLVALGKWLQEDFIRFLAGDANLGRYAGNNGTNLTDLSGLWVPSETWNNLTPQQQERWQQLAREGWTIAGEHTPGQLGKTPESLSKPMGADFGDPKNTENVRTQTSADFYWDKFAKGEDLQWSTFSWGVSFKDKQINIMVNSQFENKLAAKLLGNIIDALTEGKVTSKSGKVIEYRTDLLRPGAIKCGTHPGDKALEGIIARLNKRLKDEGLPQVVDETKFPASAIRRFRTLYDNWKEGVLVPRTRIKELSEMNVKSVVLAITSGEITRHLHRQMEYAIEVVGNITAQAMEDTIFFMIRQGPLKK